MFKHVYKNEIENIIVDLSNNGVKIFLTSHDISQIRRIGKEIIFLDKGKLIYHDCIEKFFKDKKYDFVVSYSMNIGIFSILNSKVMVNAQN